MPRWSPSALLMALLWTACAGTGGLQLDVVSPPGVRASLQAVAVYPVTFRYEYEAYESYEKTQDLVGALVASGKVLVLDSDEFRIFPGQLKSDRPFATTTLVTTLNEMEIDRSQVAVVRVWVEERVQATQATTFNKRGAGAGHAVARATTLVCHLEVLYPEGREVLFELTGSAKTDPFDEAIEWDPRPELRELLRGMAAELLGRLGDYFELGRAPTAYGFRFRTNHRRLFDFTVDQKPPYRKLVDRLDMLDREVEVQNRYRYFYPELDYRLLKQFEVLPAGLVVTAVTDPHLRRAGLAPGDIVVRWRGGPVFGAQQLQRLIHAPPSNAPSTARVSRDGKLVTLTF